MLRSSLCEAVVLKPFLYLSVVVMSHTLGTFGDEVIPACFNLANAGLVETASVICLICCPEDSVVAVRTQS